MGQKVNPTGFRLGNFIPWKSRWFASPKTYQASVLEDLKIRDFLTEKLKPSGVTQVEIERSVKKINIRIHVSRPGIVIGRGGANLEELKSSILALLKINPKDPSAPKLELDDIVEVKNPDLSAILIVERLKDQLIKRYPHRRAVAQALDRTISAGAKGVKIVLAGRIGGAEIGRTEKYVKGTVPTQTLRANIDYAESPALTKSGYVGIKVWVHRGEADLQTPQRRYPRRQDSRQ